jgi:DMSO reductase anchor subunit
MELQWPLILFTSLTAWACGVFGGAGVLALRGAGRKPQMALTVASVVLLAAGGIAVFFHLQHWERIFNGFGHITSGITQELIAIVVFVVVALVYFLKLRKSGDGAVPKALAWCAIAISVVLAAVCAHSYMMAARPAWNNVLEVASIVGAACLMGPATCAVVMAVRGDEAEPAGLPAVVGSAIGAVCTLAYAVFLQLCNGSFIDMGNYYDPTHPLKAMVDVAATASSQAPLIWGGAVIVGAIVPLVCCALARKKGDAASWKVFGAVAVVAALAGSIFLRMAFYNMGLSVFALY